jgi:hypothetical protein
VSHKKDSKKYPDVVILNKSKFSGYTYLKKVKILIANQATLAKFFKEATHVEMGGCKHNSLRMTGVTQSFFMHDSAMYIGAKEQQNVLDKDEYNINKR